MVETVHLAKPRGFCAGVVMAIEAVERTAGEMRSSDDGELVVYHSIVHNDTVVDRLEKTHGVHFVEDLADVASLDEEARSRGGKLSDTVVFSAHGVSPAVREKAAALGLATLDATCPLVTKVHNEARRYAAQGYHILLVGDSLEHQEVIGTRGQAPSQTTVVGVLDHPHPEAGLADPRTVSVPDRDRVVVITQTTLSVDLTMKTVRELKQRFPKLVVPKKDDLCYATKNRQDAVRRIASEVELFLVVTSSYSSNGMRLLELARELTGKAHGVETVRGIDAAWLQGVRSVGITSAASTPDHLVREIVDWFLERNPDLEIVEEGEWEDITFRKPRRVAPPRPATA